MSQAVELQDVPMREVQLVTFALGAETYAVDVSQVREIGKIKDITHIPKMPSFVEGVMNLRGQVTTVIDLRRRFGITGPGERTDQARIIVAEVDGGQLGVIVDAVQDVIRVPASAMAPLPKTVASEVDARFLVGIFKLPDRLVALLDLSRILSPQELGEARAAEAIA